MEQIKEYFDIKKKIVTTLFFLLFGIGLTLFGPREGISGFVEYLFYVGFLSGWINILFSKGLKTNLFFPVFLLFNLAGTGFFILLFQVNVEEIGTNVITALACLLAIALWVAESLLIKGVPFAKRVVSGFFCMVLNGLSMVVVLFFIALLRWR